MLLAFMCEGEREIDEGQLTERCLLSGVGLEEESADATKAKSKAPYGSRLGGRAGGCKKEIKSPLWESAWRKSARMQNRNQKPPMGVEPIFFRLRRA